MIFRKKVLIGGVVLIIVIIAAGYFGLSLLQSKRGTGQAGAPRPGEQSTMGPESAGPVVKVKTAAVRQAAIKRNIIAYGVVNTAPQAVHHLSVPFEARVRNCPVTPGQVVARGDVLVEIEPSPATALQVKQTRGALETAAKLLTQVRNRFDLKLATNQELLAAERDWQAAQLQMESLNKMDIDISRIKAELPGLVAAVSAQEGLIVPAGSSLVDIDEQKHMEVRLNVEPSDVPGVRMGQLVELSQVHEKEGEPLAGRVRLVTGRVNPKSRMVDVFVQLPMEARLLQEAFVRGRIVIGSKQAMLVPRSAAFPDGDKFALFTMLEGRAVMHAVAIGWEDDKSVEIISKDLKEGMPVIVEGNYELKDGMAVAAEEQP